MKSQYTKSLALILSLVLCAAIVAQVVIFRSSNYETFPNDFRQTKVPIGRVVESFGTENLPGHNDISENETSILSSIEQLQPLHRSVGIPGPGDWLESHPEPGQTFREYHDANPRIPNQDRHTIYVQPLGSLLESERAIIRTASKFLSIYLNMPVVIVKDLALSELPSHAYRFHPTQEIKQIHTGYLLYSVLAPRLPDDAAAVVGFISQDLWPGDGWNFVFGQASLEDRVGVWSIRRFGDLTVDDNSYRLSLLRTLKLASHETMHVFSMYHCTAFACNMCGSNSLRETDRHPLYLCPECNAKVCWGTNTVPIKRFQKLSEFCKENDLTEEHDYYLNALRILGE